ncbi:MAG TPA: aldo/keto reductase [Terriglobia bacterium]|nr:aldo/keto reductase [Terriglobia bacterium]
MNPTEKVKVGRTDLFVTRMGMGGAVLGGLYHEVSDEAAEETVEAAWACGVNFFDTAPLYGHGRSEERMGKVLRTHPRDTFVLSTKVGRVLVPADASTVESVFFEKPAPFEPVFDFSYDGVMRSFEESLRRLKLDRVDILLIHDPDDHYQEALLGAYPALHKLRSQGVVKAIGAGMNQAEMLARFAREGDFDCFLLAGRYTLIDHSGLRELVPLCQQKNISIIIGGPYNSGILAGGAVSGTKFNYEDAAPEIVDRVTRVEEVCRRHSVPLKAAALQFPLAHPAVVSVIPGARSAPEIEENFALLTVSIPRDFWQDLRAEGLLPGEAPVPA